MKALSILVTGGAGFLGSHVVRRLLDAGHTVRIADDFSNGKELHVASFRDHPRCSVLSADITDRSEVFTATEGMQAVVHLAALGLRQSIKEPARVNQVIVGGTLNCLDAAVEHGVDLFVNCSSSEAYGTARQVPMGEDHPLRPETPYAAAKVAQDMYVHSYGQTHCLPWVTLRPFNMYGPNSHWQGFRGELIPKLIVRAMTGRPLLLFGDGQQSRDFLYVEDAADAFMAVLQAPDCRGTEINICTGRDTTVLEIATRVCEEFDLDPDQHLEFQPARPGDVRRHIGDNRKAHDLLGFEASISLTEGISKTVAWFKSLGLSPDELLRGETGRNWE